MLPHAINLGYHQLRLLVVDKFNGQHVARLSDITEAQKLNPTDAFDTIEFEQDNPTVVIPRSQLKQADAQIASQYGIE